MKKLILVLALCASALAMASETCLWKHDLKSDPGDFTCYKYEYRAERKDTAQFTDEGIVFVDEGKRASTSHFLEFPAAVAKNFGDEVVIEVDMKAEGLETDLAVGWILKGAKFTQWTGNFKILKDTKGWKTYSFCPWNNSWPDLERFILSTSTQKNSKLFIRNFVVRKKFSNLDIAPFYNTGYQCDSTPVGLQNALGEGGRDFSKFTCVPWAKFANVPLKPHSHERNKIDVKEVVRFSNSEKLLGTKKIDIPVKDADFSARKLYLMHALWKGDQDFKGLITVRGKDGVTKLPVVFGRDIRNMDNPDNTENAFKGKPLSSNWGNENLSIVVSQFDIPSTVGPVESVSIEADPGKGLYFVFAAHLSNFEYEIDKRPLKVVRQNDEWIPFPFPKKTGVIPGSVLDTGVKKVEKVGSKGRLMSNKTGLLVAEREQDKPLRFRMTGTGAAEYDAPTPKNYEAVKEKLAKCGEKYLTDFVFAPYEEDIKKNMEKAARMLAMQRYNMIRVCGLTHFTEDLGIDFTEKEMDHFFYWVKCLRDQGIYIHYDIGQSFVWGHAWTNENGEERHRARVGINFDTKYRDLLKRGMIKVMTTVNPYTGLALKDDPIIAFINGWNESGLSFMRFTEPEAVERFSKFLSARYTSIDALKNAWGTEADANWKSFADVPVDFSWCQQKTKTVRHKDIWDFYVECQQERLNWFKTTLREIGYKGMVSDYNFGQAIEGMRSRMDGDYVVMNRYHEHPLGEWIRNRSTMQDNNELMRALASIQYLDRPFVITETGICFWNNYRYEQAFAIDAYAALNGIDVLTNFAGILPNRGGSFQRNQTSKINTFFGTYDPIMFATEFLGAHFFNMGKVKTAEKMVCLELDRDDVANEHDYNYGLGNDQTAFALVCRLGMDWKDKKTAPKENVFTMPRVTRTGIVREEFFAYTTDDRTKKFDADACIAEMKKRGFLPQENRTSIKDGIFESVTGELYMETKKKFGYVNTPKAQGIFALAGTTYSLPQLEVKEMTVNGTLTVVSSDDKDISKSKRMTVVYATNALNEGLTLHDDEMKVRVLNGKGPVLYQVGKFTATIKNKNASKLKAYVVRLDGSRDGEIPLKVKGDDVTISVDTAKLAGGPAMFFELCVK